MNTSNLRRIKGLSLIEVLVTITITSIGLMGLVSLQMQAVRATTDSGNRSQAVWLFNDIISRIHANEVESLSYITPDTFLVQAGEDQPAVCDIAGNTPRVCSSFYDGLVPHNAQVCTGVQQATWDLFEIACGVPLVDGYQGNSISYLPQAQLTIACADPNVCGNGDPLSITLQWRAKADNEAATGATRTKDSGLLTLTDVITP